MDKIFADGLMWQDPKENAPSFVKGNILVNSEKFNAFMVQNMAHATTKGWLNIVMKESKNGVIYFELNTWKPPVQESSKDDGMTSPGVDGERISLDAIPF